jgi:hypothetical protein
LNIKNSPGIVILPGCFIIYIAINNYYKKEVFMAFYKKRSDPGMSKEDK